MEGFAITWIVSGSDRGAPGPSTGREGEGAPYQVAGAPHFIADKRRGRKTRR